MDADTAGSGAATLIALAPVLRSWITAPIASTTNTEYVVSCAIVTALREDTPPVIATPLFVTLRLKASAVWTLHSIQYVPAAVTTNPSAAPVIPTVVPALAKETLALGATTCAAV